MIWPCANPVVSIVESKLYESSTMANWKYPWVNIVDLCHFFLLFRKSQKIQDATQNYYFLQREKQIAQNVNGQRHHYSTAGIGAWLMLVIKN